MKLLQQPVIKCVVSVFAATLVVAGLGAAALAQESPVVDIAPVYKNQFYIGIGAGISRVDPESQTNAIEVGDEFSEGFSVAFGYDFTSWLSLEGYAADLGSASIDFLGERVGDVDYKVYGVSALGTFYRAGSSAGRSGFSLYSRAGIGVIDTDSELDFERDNNLHVAFGVGAEYALRNGFAFRAELNSYDTDAQLAQITVLKRFGGRRVSTPSNRPVVIPPVAPAAPPAPPALTVAVPASLPKTYFNFDQHSLTADARSTVSDIAALLKDLDGLVVIEGHADHTGGEEYNQVLSVKRANAVRDMLAAQGIDPARFLVRGFGETRPAAGNVSSEGRAQNRRVEVILRAQ